MNVLVENSSLQDIADAIRSKNLSQTKYKPGEMADAIEAISGGGITPTGTISITSNNTYDVTQYASADVNVPQGSTPTGTKEITANGTGIDVASYAYADVAVPNSYSAGDEGKVVSNGALVAQGSDTVTANDTYDTTLISSMTVNVSGGGGEAHPIYYEQYTLTGDTTIRGLIDAAQYAIHSQNCIILIRSNGTTAPTSGSYSLNNYMALIINGQVYNNQSRYFYANGKVAPNSVEAHPLWGRENNTAISVTNGVLTSNSTSSSCIGSTGAIVTLCELTLDSDWLEIVLGQKSV